MNSKWKACLALFATMMLLPLTGQSETAGKPRTPIIVPAFVLEMPGCALVAGGFPGPDAGSDGSGRLYGNDIRIALRLYDILREKGYRVVSYLVPGDATGDEAKRLMSGAMGKNRCNQVITVSNEMSREGDGRYGNFGVALGHVEPRGESASTHSDPTHLVMVEDFYRRYSYPSEASTLTDDDIGFFARTAYIDMNARGALGSIKSSAKPPLADRLKFGLISGHSVDSNPGPVGPGPSPEPGRETRDDSPLMSAVRADDIDAARKLLDADSSGIDQAYGAYKFTPLMIAVWNGRENMAKLLLEHGASVTPYAVNTDVLDAAVSSGNERILIALLKAGANPNRRDPLGYGAVFKAAMSARPALLKILLDHGGDINYRDNLGNTPLMMAAYLGRSDTVRLLLERGAATYPLDASGKSVLHAARENKDMLSRNSIVAMLLDAGAKEGNPLRPIDQAFLKAVSAGDLKQSKALLAKGADLHARGTVTSNYEFIPNALDAAVKYPKLFRYLLDQGCNPFMTDPWNNTVLHFAAMHGVPETIEMLVAAGLDPNVQTKFGTTPLFQAMNGSPKVANVAALLKLGADPNTSFDHKPAIHWAREHKYTRVVELLKQAGAKE